MKQTSQSWLKLPVLLLMIAIAVVLLTATSMVDSPTARASDDAVQGPQAAPTLPSSVFISASSSGSIDKKYNSTNQKVSFKRVDILSFVPGTNTWTIYKTGSQLGIPTSVNLLDFEVLSNGDILFVIDRKKTLPGIGQVTPHDVIRYSGGTLTFELVGSTVGLTKSDENIDAVAWSKNGKLLISTTGNATYLNGISGKVPDEDLVEITGNSAALYFDGSALNLKSSSEDVSAASVDLTTSDQTLYLATKGSFSASSNVNSVSGKNTDIFAIIPSTFNPITNGFLFQYFSGKTKGEKKGIDGVSVSFTVVNADVAVSAAIDDFSANATLDETAEDTAFDQADYNDAMSQGDDQITLEDFVEVVQHVYLPVVASH